MTMTPDWTEVYLEDCRRDDADPYHCVHMRYPADGPAKWHRWVTTTRRGWAIDIRWHEIVRRGEPTHQAYPIHISDYDV